MYILYFMHIAIENDRTLSSIMHLKHEPIIRSRYTSILYYIIIIVHVIFSYSKNALCNAIVISSSKHFSVYLLPTFRRVYYVYQEFTNKIEVHDIPIIINSTGSGWHFAVEPPYGGGDWWFRVYGFVCELFSGLIWTRSYGQLLFRKKGFHSYRGPSPDLTFSPTQ